LVWSILFDTINLIVSDQRVFMQKVIDKISIDELKVMSEKMFGGLVKAVVDIELEIMVVDADLHADEEAFLLVVGGLAHSDHLFCI